MTTLRPRAALALAAALLLLCAFASAANAAVFTVDSTADQIDANPDGTCADVDGKCTLRAAIGEANQLDSDDTIILPEGRYAIGPSESPTENGNGSGDFDVSDPGGLTIKGDGTRRTVISGQGLDRVLDVLDGATLDLQGTTVRGGRAQSDLSTCMCGTELLGIAQDDLDGTGMSLNPLELVMPTEGGGLRVGDDADATLTDSAVTNNTANGFGAGGGIYNSGDLTLDHSTVHRNLGGFAGGGVANAGALVATNSTFSENVATIAGGGIANEGGTLDVDSSTINGNLSAIMGGGVFDDPADESGTDAAGDDPAAQDRGIVNSTVADNAARFGDGGGVYVQDGDLFLSGDTIVDNMIVSPDLMDLFGLLLGGGYLQGNLSWASADRGAAVYATGSSEVSFQNTIVGDSTTLGQGDQCAAGGTGGPPFVSLGHNLETGDTCGFDQAGDQSDTDPKVDDLRDNGGATETMALRSASPAIDHGDNASCFDADQRGGNRPLPAGSPGATCDVGAYEANSLADLSVEAYTDAPDAVTVGAPLTYNAVVRNDGPDTIKGVSLSQVLPSGATVGSRSPSAGTCTGDGPVTCALGDMAPGQVARVELIVRPATPGSVTSTATISATGITDTNPSNDSATTTTQVDPAGQAPLPSSPSNPQQPVPSNPPNQADRELAVNLTAPKTVSLDQFLDGIVVGASCTDEECLRRFREHAAINTGASHIAGFNLTVSRAVLARSSKKTLVRLRPCQSGSKNGKRHKRCIRNLTKAAKKARTFRVKVVVSAVDAAANKDYAKAFITVKP